ncbi:hypothetical protein RCL1_006209 [Eukaryota sp. TZLM3-RCL]
MAQNIKICSLNSICESINSAQFTISTIIRSYSDEILTLKFDIISNYLVETLVFESNSFNLIGDRDLYSTMINFNFLKDSLGEYSISIKKSSQVIVFDLVHVSFPVHLVGTKYGAFFSKSSSIFDLSIIDDVINYGPFYPLESVNLFIYSSDLLFLDSILFNFCEISKFAFDDTLCLDDLEVKIEGQKSLIDDMNFQKFSIKVPKFFQTSSYFLNLNSSDFNLKVPFYGVLQPPSQNFNLKYLIIGLLIMFLIKYYALLILNETKKNC